MLQVWRCAFQDREALRLLWNSVYAGDDPIFLDAPNRLLVEVAEQRSPGAALDVGWVKDGIQFIWRWTAGA